jgi:hypothetical protein
MRKLESTMYLEDVDCDVNTREEHTNNNWWMSL